MKKNIIKTVYNIFYAQLPCMIFAFLLTLVCGGLFLDWYLAMAGLTVAAILVGLFLGFLSELHDKINKQ